MLKLSDFASCFPPQRCAVWSIKGTVLFISSTFVFSVSTLEFRVVSDPIWLDRLHKLSHFFRCDRFDLPALRALPIRLVHFAIRPFLDPRAKAEMKLTLIYARTLCKVGGEKFCAVGARHYRLGKAPLYVLVGT